MTASNVVAIALREHDLGASILRAVQKRRSLRSSDST